MRADTRINFILGAITVTLRERFGDNFILEVQNDRPRPAVVFHGLHSLEPLDDEGRQFISAQLRKIEVYDQELGYVAFWNKRRQPKADYRNSGAAPI